MRERARADKAEASVGAAETERQRLAAELATAVERRTAAETEARVLREAENQRQQLGRWRRAWAGWRGVIFRRSNPELEELIARSQTLIPETWPGSEWAKVEKTWRLPTGATLRMRSLDRLEDVASFWGHSYSWIGWDELGAFPDDKPYRQLMACLRSAEPVEAKRIRASANPAGPGHAWIKQRFIDPAPNGYELIHDPDTELNRVFIPSRVTDNLILMMRDPNYVDRLKGVGSPELVRAWLEGDWSAVVGSYFPEFGPQHIVRPFRIPNHWLRFRAMDWGSARPFCVLWVAMCDGSTGYLPKGALYVFKEWYGASAPNVGLRLTAEQVALGIREREIGDEPCAYGVADPATFASDGGPSHRTIPTMQHDPRRPEDLDSSGDDHCCDTMRYAVTSRPWIAAAPDKQNGVSLNFLWEQRELRRQRS
jgi:hypothetical protein